MNTDLVLTANGTLEAALADLRRVKSANYADQAESGVRRYLEWAGGRSDEALVVRLEAYAAHLTDEGLQAQSVQAAVTPLKAVFRAVAKRSGGIELMAEVDQHLAYVELPKVKRGRTLPYWPTVDEIRVILRAPDLSTWRGIRDHAILCLLAGAGLRRNEISLMVYGDIRQQNGHTLLDIDNKGRRRSVVLTPGVVRALDSWAEVAEHAREADEPVFGISGRSVWDVVNKYSRAAGAAKVQPHSLRRGFARNAWEGGMDLLALQATLGHSSPKVTAEYIAAGYDPDRSNPDRYLPYRDALGLNGEG